MNTTRPRLYEAMVARHLADYRQMAIFVVIRDGEPWFLVEVKTSEDRLSPALAHFQDQIKAAHAFQVVLERPFVPANPFERSQPVIVPALTLLAQLP